MQLSDPNEPKEQYFSACTKPKENKKLPCIAFGDGIATKTVEVIKKDFI